MNILIVGNVIKDVYLNLDTRTEDFETDQNNTKWLNVGFNISEHHFFNRNSSLGGAAVSFEVLAKMGLSSNVSGSDLSLSNDGLVIHSPIKTHRYILIADGQISYLVPSTYQNTDFAPPSESYDYLYIDRSADLDMESLKKINTYLDISQKTKLVLYVRDFNNLNLNTLLSRADLLFIENSGNISELSDAPELAGIDQSKQIYISENELSYLDIKEQISVNRVDMSTHLSVYSIAAATILGSFIIGNSVENSLKMARANAENSRLDSVLDLEELQKLAEETSDNNDLEFIAANLVLHPKGILAADESGGSIKKKFDQLNIPDTYENRRDYRNLFLSTPNLGDYVNGVILFEETTEQLADNGQNFVDFLISKHIIPGIKVDQGLEKFDDSLETYTKGLDGLESRLKEYYLRGLRFAKWRAAFELRLSSNGEIVTPTDHAIEENCRILAEYASKCQSAGLVPIVEPELVYDGYYSIEKSAEVTGKILDVLFKKLADYKVNLPACILKVNMIIAGKNYKNQSSPTEVGEATAKILKEHVPESLAGVVFLSGGQTETQATDNLAAIKKQGPFPWSVTFSFARALQDPALYTWAGDNNNAEKAKSAFLERLIANTKALED